MFKAALYLTVFYLIYSVMLSRDTSYSRNRAYILVSLALAMILPGITLQNIKPLDIHLFGKYLSEVLISATSSGQDKLNPGSSAFAPFNLVFSVYLIVTAVFVLKLMSDLFNLLFLILRKKNNDDRIIRFNGFNTSGFSAMGYVFINTRLNPDEAAEIIKHEQNHLKRNHFVDIIFMGLVKAFQWFNPAAYLFNRSLRAIHEYQADQECLTSGVPVANYQSLLLNQVFKTNTFTLSNSFSNPSLIKKRMIMMTKKRTPAFANIKLLIVVPVIGLVFLFVSAFRNSDSNTVNKTVFNSQQQQSPSENIEEEPFVVVEEMPLFPGGDVSLLQYIGKNTVYPENAKKKNIDGRVIIRFCVAANGSVNRASVIKGVDPDLDAEAIRVVNTLPLFTPGRQNGKAVPVWYMVPITFTLK
jgi:TonB family protein